MPNIYSGSEWKRYKTNFNIEKFFEQVQKQSTILKEEDSIDNFWIQVKQKNDFQILFKNPKFQKFKSKL